MNETRTGPGGNIRDLDMPIGDDRDGVDGGNEAVEIHAEGGSEGGCRVRSRFQKYQSRANRAEDRGGATLVMMAALRGLAEANKKKRAAKPEMRLRFIAIFQFQLNVSLFRYWCRANSLVLEINNKMAREINVY